MRIQMKLKHRLEWRVLCCTIFANVSPFMLGYSFGLPSPIAREVKSAHLLDDYEFGLFSGMFYVAAAIGCLIAIPTMYWLGRKSVIIISAVVSVVGWMLLGSSRVPQLLICSRVVTGLGSGLSTPIVPIYIAELANKNTRGRHLSMIGISISTGLLTVFSLGIGLTYSWLSIIAVLILLVQLFAFLFLPYTPTYLVGLKLEKNALRTLQQLRGRDYDAVSEIQEIINVVAEDRMKCLSKLTLFFKLHHLKALFVVSMVMIINQSSGVNLFGSYSSELLSNEVINPNVIGLVVPGFQLIGSSFTVLLIEKVGRKILLIISLIGIIFCLLLMGTYLLLIDQLCLQSEIGSLSNSTFSGTVYTNEYLIVWPILTFLFFNLTFSLGVGPIGFIILGELIPQRIKHIVSGFGTFLLFLTTFMVVTFYPIITSQIPRSYFIYALAGFNIVLCVLIISLTPETKGKSVGDLEKLFQENTVFCCKSTPNQAQNHEIDLTTL